MPPQSQAETPDLQLDPPKETAATDPAPAPRGDELGVGTGPVIAANPSGSTVGAVFPAGVMTVPQNLARWAEAEAASMAEQFASATLQPQQLGQLESALTAVGMAALVILANANPVQVAEARAQRSLALSSLDDLKACGITNAAEAARKSVAKLFTDAADFALTAVTRFV